MDMYHMCVGYPLKCIGRQPYVSSRGLASYIVPEFSLVIFPDCRVRYIILSFLTMKSTLDHRLKAPYIR